MWLGFFYRWVADMGSDSSLQIERAAYEEFVLLWSQGSFEHQRLGQAFYNHFSLHKLTDQARLHGLYEADGEKASGLILGLFHLH
ncbi:hypothetical protein SAMN03159495_0228 [Pseudomonas sp. NFR16]|nr:hypothetical protein SAMN03159495_0228 [Pseudomonas sp. NFR16]